MDINDGPHHQRSPLTAGSIVSDESDTDTSAIDPTLLCLRPRLHEPHPSVPNRGPNAIEAVRTIHRSGQRVGRVGANVPDDSVPKDSRSGVTADEQTVRFLLPDQAGRPPRKEKQGTLLRSPQDGGIVPMRKLLDDLALSEEQRRPEYPPASGGAGGESRTLISSTTGVREGEPSRSMRGNNSGDCIHDLERPSHLHCNGPQETLARSLLDLRRSDDVKEGKVLGGGNILSGVPLGGAKSHDKLRSAGCSNRCESESPETNTIVERDETKEVSSVILPENHCY